VNQNIKTLSSKRDTHETHILKKKSSQKENILKILKFGR